MKRVPTEQILPERPADKFLIECFQSQAGKGTGNAGPQYLEIGAMVAPEDLRLEVLESATQSGVGDNYEQLAAENQNVYADGEKGRPDPNNAVPGWFFENSADITNKINWYYMASTEHLSVELGNFSGQWANYYNDGTVHPYFVVYTLPKGDGNDASHWYRSRLVYSVPSAAVPATEYTAWWGYNPPGFLSSTHVEATLDGVSSVGPQEADEIVMVANVSTSTGYPASTYKFCMEQAGWRAGVRNWNYQFVNLVGSGTGELTGAAPSSSTYTNTHCVALDGANDYMALAATGNTLNWTATWAIGITVDALPANVSDNSFMCLARSGNNGIGLRKGGTNWGIYLANGYNSVGQANTWYAPQVGSKILIQCNGTRVEYWLDGVRRANMTMNATHRDASSHVVDSLNLGQGGINFGQGYFKYWEGCLNDFFVTYNFLSSGEIAEFFGSNDVSQHSYYNAGRDFLPLGENTYPNLTGLKANVTGTLVNGSHDDFVSK